MPAPQPHPHSGRKAADARLAEFLAQGYSQKQAAAAAGVSLRTCVRRVSDPDFRGRVADLRAQMLDVAMGRLTAGTAEAALCLRQLAAPAGNRPDAVKLAAAKAVLELYARYKDVADLEARVAALEAVRALESEA